MARANINIPDRLALTAKKYAKEQGTTLTAIINVALREYVIKIIDKEKVIPDELRFTPPEDFR